MLHIGHGTLRGTVPTRFFVRYQFRSDRRSIHILRDTFQTRFSICNSEEIVAQVIPFVVLFKRVFPFTYDSKKIVAQVISFVVPFKRVFPFAI